MAILVASYENLDELDRALVELEKDPGSRPLLASIFRTIHTVKGTSGFLAFNRLEAVTEPVPAPVVAPTTPVAVAVAASEPVAPVEDDHLRSVADSTIRVDAACSTSSCAWSASSCSPATRSCRSLPSVARARLDHQLSLAMQVVSQWLEHPLRVRVLSAA